MHINTLETILLSFPLYHLTKQFFPFYFINICTLLHARTSTSIYICMEAHTCKHINTFKTIWLLITLFHLTAQFVSFYFINDRTHLHAHTCVFTHIPMHTHPHPCMHINTLKTLWLLFHLFHLTTLFHSIS